MIDIGDMIFLAAFRPCGCLSTCINATFETAERVRQEWEAKGLIVKEMTGHELITMRWACPVYRAKQHHLEPHEMANRGGE